MVSQSEKGFGRTWTARKLDMINGRGSYFLFPAFRNSEYMVYIYS